MQNLLNRLDPVADAPNAHPPHELPFQEYLRVHRGMSLRQFNNLSAEERKGILLCWSERTALTCAAYETSKKGWYIAWALIGAAIFLWLTAKSMGAN